MSRPETVVVLAKEPRPGWVKTRLTPELSPAAAAAVAAAALRDTFDAVERCAATTRVLALDGDPHKWMPVGWRYVPQPPGGLDVRLAGALEAAGSGPAVLIGMDTPQVTPDQLDAFDPACFDACFGPARDGGFWAIGFADTSLAARAICGVPMSTPYTGAHQLARLHELGLRVQRLDPLTDVDTVADAVEVARQAPGTAFAAALAGQLERAG